ncbi:hypothetical protein J437_LFUL007377 [Ladona fulva]|uniref:Uncharacterized protein n=1 Tax=Ladona fulva TaxID=123851 RepID=A0A8K0K1C8_LADFU|nr:hypothetical protein J437_LFUL007377 [Ladona fulva]
MRDIRYRWNDGTKSVGISPQVELPQFRVLGHRQRATEINLSTGRVVVGVPHSHLPPPLLLIPKVRLPEKTFPHRAHETPSPEPFSLSKLQPTSTANDHDALV